MKPVHHRRYGPGNRALWQFWPVDQDHRQLQGAGRRQFGIRPRTTGVFGHDGVDCMGLQQRQIARFGEGATGDQDRGSEQGQRQRAARRIDKAQQVVVLGLPGESRQMQTANRQKHPARRASQRLHRACDIRHLGPSVLGSGLPFGALQRDQRHPRCGSCVYGMGRHLGGKGVGGIDQMADPIVGQIADQPLGATKTAHSGWHRLGARTGDATGVGQGGRQTGGGDGMGKGACLGGAAQDQDIRHG